MALSKAEKSYIQSSLLSSLPLRADGRDIHAYRSIALETGVAPLANGSARVSIGNKTAGAGGTEVLAASKLEVNEDEGHGNMICSVFCSPAAYPHLSSSALDDLQHDLTAILNQTISHPSLHPANLDIIPGKKAWLLNLDLVVFSDAGNVYDALFMAARAALWDTKVPRTRSVAYKAKIGAGASGSGDMDIDVEGASGFDTRQISKATDFELPDYWDEGEVLGGQDKWPVSVTLNLASTVHYLDATLQEEAATPLRLLLVFSFPKASSPCVQAMHLLGPGEVDLIQIKSLLKKGEGYARDIFTALDSKLKDEDLRRNRKARDKFARR